MSFARGMTRAGIGAAVLCAVALMAPRASADEISSVESEVREIRDQAIGLEPRYLKAGGLRSAHYAEERLIDGENFYRLKDYQRGRITAFMNPEADIRGAGWHAHHARIDVVGKESLLRLQDKMDFGAARHQNDVGRGASSAERSH